MFTRQQFNASAPWLLGSSLALSGCSQGPAADSYEVAVGQTGQLGALKGFKGDVLFDPATDAVRVTLAPTAAHATDLFKATALGIRNAFLNQPVEAVLV